MNKEIIVFKNIDSNLDAINERYPNLEIFISKIITIIKNEKGGINLGVDYWNFSIANCV